MTPGFLFCDYHFATILRSLVIKGTQGSFLTFSSFFSTSRISFFFNFLYFLPKNIFVSIYLFRLKLLEKG